MRNFLPKPSCALEIEEVTKINTSIGATAFNAPTNRVPKKVILLYYYEELTLKEISRVLDVSESRVSQLHTKALQKLQKQMGDYADILYY